MLDWMLQQLQTVKITKAQWHYSTASTGRKHGFQIPSRLTPIEPHCEAFVEPHASRVVTTFGYSEGLWIINGQDDRNMWLKVRSHRCRMGYPQRCSNAYYGGVDDVNVLAVRANSPTQNHTIFTLVEKIAIERRENRM